MLEQLRENKSSAIIYLLFGIIILAFVFTFNTSGGGGGACSGGDDFVAAEVDEVDVTMGNLKVAMQLSMPPNVDMDRLQKNPQLLGYIAQTHLFRLNQESEYLAFSANENIEENLAACAGLTNAEQLRSCYERILTSVALSNLTETITVSNAARELGFRISDTELSDFIREWAMGQDGSEEFDMESYSRLVQYGLGTSKQEFEELVRRELLRHKMIQYITAHTVVDDTIVDAFTKNLGDQVGVEALVVTSDSIAEGITVSEADAKAYAADAKNAEGLQSVYDERKSEFVKPDRVKLRGLFKKAQAPARIAAQSDAAKKTLWETERAAAKTAADALLTQLKETPAPPAEPGTPAPTLGERISDLTEQSDHGSSKAKGGDLGVLGQEEITKKLSGHPKTTAASVTGMH